MTYFMSDFQMDYLSFLRITYVLAMASTPMAVMLGSAVEDPKLATEMRPLFLVPQMLFAGFFVDIPSSFLHCFIGSVSLLIDVCTPLDGYRRNFNMRRSWCYYQIVRNYQQY
jgi:hypothetical protein